MHVWGDTDFDWKALTESEHIMYKYGTRIGRVGGQIKEKYGTLRYYANFNGFSIQNLVYPGYYSIMLPKWFYWKIDYPLSQTLYRWIGLNWLFFQWQKFWYSYAYNLAVKRYPHITDEILSCADHQDLIKNYHKLRWDVMMEYNEKRNEKYWAALEQIEEYEKTLEWISDPTKRDHKEPDDYTEKCCMMNKANEVLEKYKEKPFEISSPQ